MIDDANEQAVNEAIDEHENGKENTDSEDTSFAIKQAEIEYAKVTKLQTEEDTHKKEIDEASEVPAVGHVYKSADEALMATS